MGDAKLFLYPYYFTKKRYATYCIPLVVVDAVEKQVVDRLDKRKNL